MDWFWWGVIACVGVIVVLSIVDVRDRQNAASELRSRFSSDQINQAHRIAVARGILSKGEAMERSVLTFNISVAQLTERSFLAVTELGGMNIRGQRSSDPLAAVQSLLSGLCGHDHSNSDGVLGLDLALNGTDLAELARLGAGNSDTDAS